MKQPNYRALQMTGCLQLNRFNPSLDVLPHYFGGATWKANLHKEGRKHEPNRGGPRKPSGKSRLKINMLPTEVRFDKKGYVIHG